MIGIDRRQFLSLAVPTGLSMLAPRSARAADSRVEVLLGEPIGTIAPEIYGHFAEHLGGVIYDGIWVGEKSKVENVGGIRKTLVDHMKRLPAAVIRWPGGCFADSYDWRDGVGPRDKRPRRTNFWADAMKGMPDGPEKYDPNEFGTNDFLRFCRLAGMRPYIAANVRSLPARDFYQWVEYCNAPAGTTSLADLRVAGGERDPFPVRYWGIGNESWGCGGNFTPEEYATEFRRFTAWVPRYGVEPAFIGAGPNSGDISWTRRFFSKMAEKGEGQLGSLWGWALHHYSWNVSRGRTTNWNEGKGDALRFTTDEWYELLEEGDKMDALITNHWAAMGDTDRRRRVKLVVDEWGAWHKPGTEPYATHLLGQVSTLRDAVLAGLTLDTFNRHADKVAMANVAQLVNCLHSLFLAHEDRFVVTPNFHVFEMYAPHAGGQSVRTMVSAPTVGYDRVDGRGSFWGLAGSASLKEKTLTVTVVNPHASEARGTEVVVRGAGVRSGRALTLTARELNAHNSFDQPRALEPKEAAATIGAGGVVSHAFAPASVTRLTLELA